MHVGSLATVKYRGEVITREIIRVADYGAYKLYWLEGIMECFTRADLE